MGLFQIRDVGYPTEKLRTISLDYVRDDLYTLEADGVLTAINLQTLERRVVGRDGPDARAMLNFNGYRYLIDG